MTNSYSTSALTDSGIVADINSTSSSSSTLQEQLNTRYNKDDNSANDCSMDTCSSAFSNVSKLELASKIEDACNTRSEEVQRHVSGNQLRWSEQTISTQSSMSNYNSMSETSTSHGCGV